MDIVGKVFVNTPWWVYVLLVYLIRIGIKASKMHTVKLRIIFIIPLVLVFMSLHTLLTVFTLNKIAVLTWIGATILGVILGWLQVYRYVLKVDKNRKLIQLPGTWSTLVIILIMFSLKYYFNSELTTNGLFVRQPLFENSALIIFGVGTGFFIGKLLCFLYRFKTLKHSNLGNLTSGF